MKNPVPSTSHHNTLPFPAAQAGRDEPASDAVEAPAGPREPTRGRPREYAPRIIDMMCSDIREFGLSDSAAAESVGMSSSTISRWKQLYPEIIPKLQEAWQECRKYHLRNIQKHADSDKATSLRASMWILERVYPEDYARRASERVEHRQAAEWRRQREADEFREEQCAEQLRAELARDRAQREAEQNAAAEEMAQRAATTSAAAAEGAPTCESASHNSRNADEARTPEPAAPTAATPSPTPDSCIHSEEASHNSRNSAAAQPQGAAKPSEAACAAAWLAAFENDPRNSQKWLEAQEASRADSLRASSVTAAHNSRNSAPGAVLAGPIGPSCPVF